ncbi:hypothetical protein K488DRAFT_35280, partial [Vararia minispora EC-137]
GVNTTLSSSFISKNHASSLLDPLFIDSYLESEEKAGRYSRGYSPPELESLIGPFRTSPL